MMAVIKVPVISLALQLFADAAIWESPGHAKVGDVRGVDKKSLAFISKDLG